MHPYWFFIGPLPIRAYSTIFVSAFLGGLVVALYVMKAEGKQKYSAHALDMAFWLFIGGILGARFWQVFFFDPGYYLANPMEIPAIWHGGLSIQGGLVGAIITAVIYCRKFKLPFWALADCFAPGMILGQSIGRDANLMNGDAFGAPNPGGFGLVYPPGSLAAQTYPGQVLWPAEVWEGQLDVIIFVLIILYLLTRKKRTQGSAFFLYMTLYNAARIFLEMLRGDSPRFLGWTAAQWTSIAVIALCAALWVYLWQREKRLGPPAEDESVALPDTAGAGAQPAADTADPGEGDEAP